MWFQPFSLSLYYVNNFYKIVVNISYLFPGSIQWKCCVPMLKIVIQMKNTICTMWTLDSAKVRWNKSRFWPSNFLNAPIKQSTSNNNQILHLSWDSKWKKQVNWITGGIATSNNSLFRYRTFSKHFSTDFRILRSYDGVNRSNHCVISFSLPKKSTQLSCYFISLRSIPFRCTLFHCALCFVRHSWSRFLIHVPILTQIKRNKRKSATKNEPAWSVENNKFSLLNTWAEQEK